MFTELIGFCAYYVCIVYYLMHVFVYTVRYGLVRYVLVMLSDDETRVRCSLIIITLLNN